jgi:predicted MFS family arabinose efflux permease
MACRVLWPRVCRHACGAPRPFWAHGPILPPPAQAAVRFTRRRCSTPDEPRAASQGGEASVTRTLFAPLRHSLALLGTARFGTFWVASLLSSIGTWTQQVAEPWLLLSLGASSFLVGLDAFASNAPVLLLALPGGLLADRADRRRVIVFFQSIQMMCPVAVVALLVTGGIQPWMVVVLSLVVGITDALSMPAFQSIVPLVVPRDRINDGLALNAAQFNLSRILGPSFAGLLMAGGGAVACFSLSALSYVPFTGVAWWLLPSWKAPARTFTGLSPGGLWAGARRVLAVQKLRGALATVLVTSFLGAPLVTFTAVLVRDAFHQTAAHFSTAMAAFGMGGVVGSLGLLALPPGVDRRRVASATAVILGLLVVCCAVNPWFWSLPPLLVAAGAAMTATCTAANSILQSSVSRDALGQVTGLYMVAMRGGISLGALLGGFLMDAAGVRTALLFSGILAVVLQVWVAWAWGRPPATVLPGPGPLK